MYHYPNWNVNILFVFHLQINQAKEYMRYRKVPIDLQKRVLEYYEHRYQRKFFDENAFLNEQSTPIRRVSFCNGVYVWKGGSGVVHDSRGWEYFVCLLYFYQTSVVTSQQLFIYIDINCFAVGNLLKGEGKMRPPGNQTRVLCFTTPAPYPLNHGSL